MRALTGSTCLDVWERGRQLHPLDRGLLALSFSLPEISPEDFADWQLGRRNQALLELYGCFSGRFEAWTSCKRCGEGMELELNVRDVLEQRGEGTASTVTVEEREYRLPSSRDLAAVAREHDALAASFRLIQRCLVQGRTPEPLTDVEVQQVEERMAAADPLADIRLTLCCPTCSFGWEESLDVAGFLWAEIERRGRRLLGEVHTLARAYGWTEGEILSLSSSRRSLYLEMNGGSGMGPDPEWTQEPTGRVR